MFKYFMIKSNDSNQSTYGIEVLEYKNGNLIFVDEITNVSSDQEFVKRLVDDCNTYQLDPVHLRDVIEDRLFSANL